jgi:hypothetical protein
VAVDISAHVTANFPTTEALLEDASDGVSSYATHKANMIAKAKRKLYGAKSVPSSEDDIPERAGYWIADQATVYLIPLAKSWYMENTRLSDKMEDATISWHDRIAALSDLKAELEADLREGLEGAQDAIDAQEVSESVPEVSGKGMAVDPLDRAMRRGPWG